MQATETMNTRQTAERLGVDPRTVLRWVDAGKLEPLTKVPGWRGAYLFAVSEVERCAATQQGEKAAS